MSTAIKIAGVSALALLAALTGCGGASTVTIRGDVQPSSNSTSVLGVTADTYDGCAEASPAPGTQITVSSPDGKIIGTATLGEWSHASAMVEGVTAYTCDMPFTMTNVPAETRYGFSIDNVPGKIWVTSIKHVDLSVTSG